MFPESEASRKSRGTLSGMLDVSVSCPGSTECDRLPPHPASGALFPQQLKAVWDVQ